MDQRRFQRNTSVLWAMILLAFLYIVLVRPLFLLSGSNRLVGSIGVVIGLYICSHPAANAVDLLFYKRDVLGELSHAWSGIAWLVLNSLVLVIGWIVIVIGATRFTGPM